MKAKLQSFKFKVTFTNHDPMATCRCSVNQTEIFTIKDYYESLARNKLYFKLFNQLKLEDITFKIEPIN